VALGLGFDVEGSQCEDMTICIVMHLKYAALVKVIHMEDKIGKSVFQIYL
jgi:hypothetical protein